MSDYYSMRYKIISIPQLIQVQPEMHKVACKHCPSNRVLKGLTENDPECEDILKMPHAFRVETAFACGWSPIRYCRGYCEQMGISNEDLQKIKR